MATFSNAVVMAVGSGGDVAPFAAIAKKLVERGISTTLLAPERYRAYAAGTGAMFESIGAETEFSRVFGGPRVWDKRQGFPASWEYYGAAMRSGYHKLVTQWSPENTTVISSSFAVAARLAEEHDGFRNLTVHLSPSILFSAVSPSKWSTGSIPERWPLAMRRLALYMAERLGTDPVMSDHINKFRAELGLGHERHLFSRWIHSPKRIAYAFPEWFAPAANDWPRQGVFAGFTGPAFANPAISPKVKEFISQAHKGLAVITAGTAVLSRPQWVEEACRQAVLRGMKVIEISPQPSGISRPDLLQVPFVPFQGLLSSARVVVHHAGIGTALSAMRFGVPQLLHPTAHDQPDNAARLQALGLARILGRDQKTGWDWLDQAAITPALHVIRRRLRSSIDGSETIADLALD